MRDLSPEAEALVDEARTRGLPAEWPFAKRAVTPVEHLRRRFDLMARISRELDRAYAKHGRAQWGRHEFYGIIKEEFDELWADIKSDAPQEQLEKELVQVAAMCFRYFETRDRYREPAQ